jgi:hypothetical protein
VIARRVQSQGRHGPEVISLTAGQGHALVDVTAHVTRTRQTLNTRITDGHAAGGHGRIHLITVGHEGQGHTVALILGARIVRTQTVIVTTHGRTVGRTPAAGVALAPGRTREVADTRVEKTGHTPDHIVAVDQVIPGREVGRGHGHTTATRGHIQRIVNVSSEKVQKGSLVPCYPRRIPNRLEIALTLKNLRRMTPNS